MGKIPSKVVPPQIESSARENRLRRLHRISSLPRYSTRFSWAISIRNIHKDREIPTRRYDFRKMVLSRGARVKRFATGETLLQPATGSASRTRRELRNEKSPLPCCCLEGCTQCVQVDRPAKRRFNMIETLGASLTLSQHSQNFSPTLPKQQSTNGYQQW